MTQQTMDVTDLFEKYANVKKSKKEKLYAITGMDMFFYWQELGELLQQYDVEGLKVSTSSPLVVTIFVKDENDCFILNNGLSNAEKFETIENWHKRERDKKQKFFFAPLEDQNYFSITETSGTLKAECMIVRRK